MKLKSIWISWLFLISLCWASVPASATTPDVWLPVPYGGSLLVSPQSWNVAVAPLHGTLESSSEGLIYTPEDDFWGILNDTLVLDEPAGATTYRLYGVGVNAVHASGFEGLEMSSWLSGLEGSASVTEAAAIVGDRGLQVTDWGWLGIDTSVYATAQAGTSGELGGQTATVANAMICPPTTFVGTTEDPAIIEGVANGVPQFTIYLVDGRTLRVTAGGQTADGPTLEGQAASLSMSWNSQGRFHLIVNGQTLFSAAIADHRIDELRMGVLDNTPGWGLFFDELFIGEVDTATAASTGLFSDDFDGMSTANWSAAEAAGIQVTAAAALIGSGGLEVHPGLFGDTDTYVIDTGLASEADLGVRFVLDPNDVGIAVGDGFDILAGSDADAPAMGEDHLRLHLRRGNFGYLLKVVVRLDSGAVGTPWVALNGEPQSVELQWRASDSSLGDGYMHLWVDGDLKQSLTGLSNQTRHLESIRIGALSADAAYSGWLILDEYQAWSPE